MKNENKETQELWAELKKPNPDAQYISGLIEAGANKDVKDQQDETALHLAASLGRTAAVQALLDAGADKKATRRNDGWTALHCAACNNHTETVQTLLDAGAEIDATANRFNVLRSRNRGNTALHVAALTRSTDTIQALLAAGADVTVQNNNGKTALHFATEYGNTTTVQALLDAGAEIEATTLEENKTALHLASKDGHAETVQALIDSGADKEATDAWDQTALHIAAKNGHTGPVQALLAASADISTIKNQETLSPGLQAMITANTPAEGKLPLMAALSAEHKHEEDITRLIHDRSIMITEMLDQISKHTDDYSPKTIEEMLCAAALENCFYGESAREPVDCIMAIHAKADECPEERKKAIHQATRQAIVQQTAIFKERVTSNVTSAMFDLLDTYNKAKPIMDDATLEQIKQNRAEAYSCLDPKEQQKIKDAHEFSIIAASKQNRLPSRATNTIHGYLAEKEAYSQAALLAQVKKQESNSQQEKGKAPEKQDPEKQSPGPSDRAGGGGGGGGGGK